MDITKMRYSIEPRNRTYVKSCRFLSFAKNIGKNISNRYSQKLVDSAKIICNRCNKNCFKKGNSKTAETTGDLIGNKIADKITSVSKISPKELNSKMLPSNEANNEMPKNRYISTRKINY